VLADDILHALITAGFARLTDAALRAAVDKESNMDSAVVVEQVANDSFHA
jgi:hypothetical protein